MMTCACNHSTEEIEAGAAEAQSEFIEFEDSHIYIRHFLKKQNQINKKTNVKNRKKNNQLLEVDST